MGVQIQGDTGNVIATKGTYSGDVSIGGTLTYEDVTNIDAVGIITARSGIEIGASPGVGASISVDGNAIFSGITTVATLKATTGIVTTLTANTGTFSDTVTFNNTHIDIADSIRHIGDSDAKIRFPADDTFSVETAGSERLRIASDGDLVISGNGSVKNIEYGDGTTTGYFVSNTNVNRASADAAIHLQQFRWNNTKVAEIKVLTGDDTTNKDNAHITFETASAGTTGERLRITSEGRLLVNTTAERNVGGAVSRLIEVESSGGGAGISIARNQNTASPPTLDLGKSRGYPHTIVQDDDKLGIVNFCGADGTDLQTSAAQVVCEVDGTPGENDMPGRLIFKTTADGSNSPTERLRITSSGGILATLGSSNSDNFDIQGHASQGRTILKLIAGNADSTASTSLRLVRSNGTNVLSLSLTHNSDDGHMINAATGGAIKFHVNESGSSLVRHVMTDTGHFVNCRGSSGRIAFGTSAGVLYSGMGRYDGAAQDVGLSLYATTNAGTSFVEHFRMTHNGTLQATDTSIGSLSDSRLKKNIGDYSYDISKFKQFKPKTFDWINPEVHGDKTSVKGFTAQDIELIDSDWVEETFVSKDDPDFSLVSDTTTTNGAGETVGVSKASKFGYKDAMYISVVQQLITRIETLETKVAALEG